MRKSITIIVLALATAACGDVAPNQQAPRPAEPVVNSQASQDRILALPKAQRLAVFANAIRDSGQDCQVVNSAEAGGTYQGLPVWRATCRGGTVWTIVIGNDGAAAVLNPNEAALIQNQFTGAETNAH